MNQESEVILDYRKCSYKDRLKILQELKSENEFSKTKSGQRLLVDLQNKLDFEKLTEADFDTQRKRHWKVQGKHFRAIFSEVWADEIYPMTYGMMSESIHGSWNDSVDYCLYRNEQGYFQPHTINIPSDIRSICPILPITIKSFHLWLGRVGLDEDAYLNVLRLINQLNETILARFDLFYDGDFRSFGHDDPD